MKRMLTFATISAALAVTGAAAPFVVSNASAEPIHAAATEVARGAIESVDLENNQFVLKIEGPQSESEQMTIKINERTSYTLDGKASTKQDALKAGRGAVVAHDGGVALSVDVKTPKPE